MTRLPVNNQCSTTGDAAFYSLCWSFVILTFFRSKKDQNKFYSQFLGSIDDNYSLKIQKTSLKISKMGKN